MEAITEFDRNFFAAIGAAEPVENRIVTQSDMLRDSKDYIQHLKRENRKKQRINDIQWLLLAAVFGAVIVIGIVAYGA